MTLTHVDLFSGIGGLALAARWAGFQTTLFCEIDPYCRRVLRRHWPEVPQHDDVRTIDGKAFQGPTLLTGGFPCQPFSTAGKRKGKADDRHLWPEMFRVIRESRPAWIVGENVAGFVRLALDDVLSDLEGEGYACRAFLVPACGVGAPHRRERCFVVAHAASFPGSRTVSRSSDTAPGEWPSDDTAPCRGAVAHASGAGWPTQSREWSQPAALAEADDAGPRRRRGPLAHALRQCLDHPKLRTANPGRACDWRQWQGPEPGVGRMVDGVPHRVGRLKALGNAVVPQQIYPFLQVIADIETAIPLTAEAA